MAFKAVYESEGRKLKATTIKIQILINQNLRNTTAKPIRRQLTQAEILQEEVAEPEKCHPPPRPRHTHPKLPYTE